jgi:hypothetical protein
VSFQAGGKSAVGSVAMRPCLHVPSFIHHFRRHKGTDILLLKIEVMAEKIFNDTAVFARQDAAGAIDENTAGLDKSRGGTNELHLQSSLRLQMLGASEPTNVGIAAQKPKARTRHIHQNSVKSLRQNIPAVLDADFDTLHAQPHQIFL